MRRWIGSRAQHLLALLAVAFHTACASIGGAPEAGVADPSLWTAQLPGAGRLYLMGSVHLGTPAPVDLGQAFAKAWHEATELVLEVDLSLYDEEDGRELAGRYGSVEPPETLKDRLEPATWTLLQAYLETRGMPEETILPYQPWFVATAITVIEFQLLGYDPEHGVDRVLLGRATGDKPIVGLETLESQFALLSGLPLQVQDLMLRDMLEHYADFAGETRDMIAAWRFGDDVALEGIVFRQIDQPEFAAFYESILFRRNLAMAEQIAELAKDGKTRLVVVGVAHMLGDKGIPALLLRRGFQVEKMAAP